MLWLRTKISLIIAMTSLIPLETTTSTSKVIFEDMGTRTISTIYAYVISFFSFPEQVVWTICGTTTSGSRCERERTTSPRRPSCWRSRTRLRGAPTPLSVAARPRPPAPTPSSAATSGGSPSASTSVLTVVSFTLSVSVNAAMMPAMLVWLKTVETNKVAPEWGCNPFCSDSIDFSESCIASVITALHFVLTLTLDVGPLQGLHVERRPFYFF